MNQISTGKTILDIESIATNKNYLAELLKNTRIFRVPIIRMKNEVFKVQIEYIYDKNSKTYRLNSTFSLVDYKKFPNKLIMIEREFNNNREILIQQTKSELERTGIVSTLNPIGLNFKNNAEIAGNGTLYSYLSNDYKLPSDDELGPAANLLSFEISMCSIVMSVFYDVANLIILNNETNLRANIISKFKENLNIDIDSLISKFIDLNETKSNKQLFKMTKSKLNEIDKKILGEVKNKTIN